METTTQFIVLSTVKGVLWILYFLPLRCIPWMLRQWPGPHAPCTQEIFQPGSDIAQWAYRSFEVRKRIQSTPFTVDSTINWNKNDSLQWWYWVRSRKLLVSHFYFSQKWMMRFKVTLLYRFLHRFVLQGWLSRHYYPSNPLQQAPIIFKFWLLGQNH